MSVAPSTGNSNSTYENIWLYLWMLIPVYARSKMSTYLYIQSGYKMVIPSTSGQLHRNRTIYIDEFYKLIPLKGDKKFVSSISGNSSVWWHQSTGDWYYSFPFGHWVSDILWCRQMETIHSFTLRHETVSLNILTVLWHSLDTPAHTTFLASSLPPELFTTFRSSYINSLQVGIVYV